MGRRNLTVYHNHLTTQTVTIACRKDTKQRDLGTRQRKLAEFC